MSTKRKKLIHSLAQQISKLELTHPVRVAIDGIDASGKTTLANELVIPLESLGRSVIRASIDGFHNPRKVRYQRGADSPEGYFLDSFDYETLKTSLLEPLGPNGNRRYRTSVFDFQKDIKANSPKSHAPRNSILVFDGVFLLRPEFVHCWDFTIFLDIDFDVAVERASDRDQYLFGSVEDVKRRYWQRYLPGQRMYLETCRPREQATVVIDNSDPMKPYYKQVNAIHHT